MASGSASRVPVFHVAESRGAIFVVGNDDVYLVKDGQTSQMRKRSGLSVCAIDAESQRLIVKKEDCVFLCTARAPESVGTNDVIIEKFTCLGCDTPMDVFLSPKYAVGLTRDGVDMFVWDPRDGHEIMVVSDIGARFFHFSPKEDVFILAGGGRVFLFDAVTRTIFGERFLGEEEPIEHAGLTEDGSVLCLVTRGTHVFLLSPHFESSYFTDDVSNVTCVGCGESDSFLLGKEDGSICEVTYGSNPTSVSYHLETNSPVVIVEYVSQRQAVIVLGDGTVLTMDLNQGKCLKYSRADEPIVACVYRKKGNDLFCLHDSFFIDHFTLSDEDESLRHVHIFSE